jgi:hypothetical protein
MSLIAVAIANGILAVAILAALAYVCRIPYRLDRHGKPKELLAGGEERKQLEPAHERYAA